MNFTLDNSAFREKIEENLFLEAVQRELNWRSTKIKVYGYSQNFSTLTYSFDTNKGMIKIPHMMGVEIRYFPGDDISLMQPQLHEPFSSVFAAREIINIIDFQEKQTQRQLEAQEKKALFWKNVRKLFWHRYTKQSSLVRKDK